MAKDKDLIIQHYIKLTDAVEDYREKWICDETVLRLINTHFPSLKGTLNFTRKNLNSALRSAAGLFNETNKLCIFVVDFQTVCQYAETKRAVKFYYRGSVGNPIPARPSCAGACEDALAKSFQLKQNRVRDHRR